MYLAGTGSTGVGMMLIALGASYFVTMLASALAFRLPPANHAEVVLARQKEKKAASAAAAPTATTPVPEPVKKVGSGLIVLIPPTNQP